MWWLVTDRSLSPRYDPALQEYIHVFAQHTLRIEHLRMSSTSVSSLSHRKPECLTWYTVKIKNGSQPPLWKHTNHHNSATLWDIINKFWKEIDTGQPRLPLTPHLSDIKMAAADILIIYFNCHKSLRIAHIHTKFVPETKAIVPETQRSSNVTYAKIHEGGQLPISSSSWCRTPSTALPYWRLDAKYPYLLPSSMLHGPQSSGAGHTHLLFLARWLVGDQRASWSLFVVLQQRRWQLKTINRRNSASFDISQPHLVHKYGTYRSAAIFAVVILHYRLHYRWRLATMLNILNWPHLC